MFETTTRCGARIARPPPRNDIHGPNMPLADLRPCCSKMAASSRPARPGLQARQASRATLTVQDHAPDTSSRPARRIQTAAGRPDGRCLPRPARAQDDRHRALHACLARKSPARLDRVPTGKARSGSRSLSRRQATAPGRKTRPLSLKSMSSARPLAGGRNCPCARTGQGISTPADAQYTAACH